MLLQLSGRVLVSHGIVNGRVLCVLDQIPLPSASFTGSLTGAPGCGRVALTRSIRFHSPCCIHPRSGSAFHFNNNDNQSGLRHQSEQNIEHTTTASLTIEIAACFAYKTPVTSQFEVGSHVCLFLLQWNEERRKREVIAAIPPLLPLLDLTTTFRSWPSVHCQLSSFLL
jgi:hypothetical protein